MKNIRVFPKILAAIAIIHLFGSHSSRAQKQNTAAKIGFPFIKNYTPKDYKAHAQCWGMTQGSDGRMYFGNSDGILEFDGNAWNKIVLPGRTIVRNVVRGDDDIIYCSGNGDFGYLKRNKIGASEYVSIRNFIPEEHKNFNDVWSVMYFDGEVFYATINKIYIWNVAQKSMKVIVAKSDFRRLYALKDRIWLSTSIDGIFEYNGDTFLPLTSTNQPKGRAFGICNWTDNKILVTYDQGIFMYKDGVFNKLPTEVDSELPAIYVLKAERINSDLFSLVTASNGLFVLDGAGQLVHKVTEDNGLLSSSLHWTFLDKENALWVSSNFGASRLEYNLPLRILDKRNRLEDTVNDILRFNDTLYVSTHSGVFYFADKNAPNFNKINTPIKEAFDLEIINNRLYVSSTEGLFVKGNETDFDFLTDDYCYKFIQSNKDSSLIFIGSIDGLITLSLPGHERKSLTHLVAADIRDMKQDSEGNLWIGTTTDNKLTKIDFYQNGTFDAPLVKVYDQEDGLPQTAMITSFLGDKLYFNSEFGVYELKGEKFILSKEFEHLKDYVHLMFESGSGTVYSLHNFPPFMSINAFEPKNGKYELVSIPELQTVESEGLWTAYEDTDHSIWVGRTDGIMNYKPKNFTSDNQKLMMNISSVKIDADSILHENLNPKFERPGDDVKIGFEHNSIRFEYSLPVYRNEDKNAYQHRLVGLEDEWSQWSLEYIREYVGLNEGKYTFQVRGKNIHNQTSDVMSYSFQVLPPWYRTIGFILLMILIVGSVLTYFIRFFAQRKLILRVEELELQQKLQAERERISGDLHDHVGAQLTSIISGLQITEQIEDINANPNIKKLMDSLKDDAQNTMINLRDSIWSLNKDTITIDSFVEHIHRFLESYLKYQKEISFKIESDVDSKLVLGPVKALNITRAIEEAVQNIVKHANASHILISIRCNDKEVTVSIQDDGIGFDQNTVEGEHYGLENMQRRMEEVDGKLAIESVEGSGTKVQLSV